MLAALFDSGGDIREGFRPREGFRGKEFNSKQKRRWGLTD
jgi:hypothetical protein